VSPPKANGLTRRFSYVALSTYRMARKIGTFALHVGLDRTYQTVLKTISFSQCSEEWSCWTLCSSVQHNHPSLQW